MLKNASASRRSTRGGHRVGRSAGPRLVGVGRSGGAAGSSGPSSRRRRRGARLGSPSQQLIDKTIEVRELAIVRIGPPGMFTDQRIRLKGQGIGGGDLYLKITVLPHPLFRLEGTDVVCVIPVTPSEAVLGGPIEVPTLDGPVSINIPPSVSSGQRLRLAGKGYPSEEGRGDQIVEIQLVLPKTLTPEERDCYERLRSVETFNPRANLLG